MRGVLGSWFRFSFVLASLIWGNRAFADPPQAGAEATSAVRSIDPGALEDPNADRQLLFPTALTQPARTLTVSNYLIFGLGLTYGITDRLQVTTTAVFGGGLFLPKRIVMGSLKWQALRVGGLRLALMGGATQTVDENLDRPRGLERRRSILSPQAGLVASYCLTDDCHSMMTANVHGVFPVGHGASHSPELLYSVGATLRLSDHFKLMLEGFRATEVSQDPDRSSSPAASASVRAFGRHWAVELGVVAFFGSHGDALPLPFLSGSLRF